jgi:hypothetical protein
MGEEVDEIKFATQSPLAQMSSSSRRCILSDSSATQYIHKAEAFGHLHQAH